MKMKYIHNIKFKFMEKYTVKALVAFSIHINTFSTERKIYAYSDNILL